MKKKILLLSTVLLLASCNSNSPIEKNNQIKISFEENALYTLTQNTFSIEKNKDLVINLSFSDHTTFASCNYSGNYNFIGDENGSGTLILYSVSYPQRVHIDLKVENNGIRYHLNGGKYINSSMSNNAYVKWYDISSLKRTNTDRGTDSIERDGYVLTGWSTKSDYSLGERIGLGSRVTLTKDSIIDLYAIWEKETDLSLFNYAFENDNAYITKYTGQNDVDTIVIPKYKDGKKIVGIKKDAFINVKTTDLVLSENIEKVDSYAFKNCSINTIRFSDSLLYVYDDSFSNTSVDKFQINAFYKPRYQKEETNSQFANDIDHMIMNESSNRLLFYAGCSMSYGLKCETINLSFPKYKALNLGVIGGSTAGHAFDIISHYAHEGDIFIHAPEVASKFQLMNDNATEVRMFIGVEGNYDLFQYVNINEIPGIFTCFSNYQLGRISSPECEYSDDLTSYNEYGDICIDRSAQSMDTRHNGNLDSFTYRTDLITESSTKALIAKYDMFDAKGVKVYFSYSPVNKNGLPDSDVQTKTWNIFGNACENMLKNTKYSVISKPDTYLFSGRYFYDTDYHLNDLGAKSRTNYLINDLKQYIK